jgi:GNAT superfamily N-acetyltransferase
MKQFHIKSKLLNRVIKFLNNNDIVFQISFCRNFYHRNGKTPTDKVYVFNLYSNITKKVVAEYTFLPMKLLAKEKIFLGGQSSSVWVDKNFQGKGLSSYLISKSLEYLKNQNYTFHYGFPNEKIYKIYKNSINVEYIGIADFIIKLNKTENILKKKNIKILLPMSFFFNFLIKLFFKLFFFYERNKEYKIESINRFTSEIDIFIEANINKNLIYFQKNFSELNWRYSDKRYKIFLAKNKYSEICGYLIGSVQKKEGLNVAAIIDFHLKKGEETKILYPLLKNFEKYYENCDLYCYLCLPHQIEKKFLKKFFYFSFNTSKLKRSFWMFFQPLNEINLNYKKSENWHISFYDSLDTF